MPARQPAGQSDAELQKLRSNISDIAFQIDSQKTKVGAAMGGGVFVLLIALLLVFDLATGKSNAWLAIGAPRESLIWIAFGLAVGALGLLTYGFALRRKRDPLLQARLDEMERQYAELLDSKSSDNS